MPLERLQPFLSARFLKFAAVGASGVLVNLGSLALFTSFGAIETLASALAIQVSILTNFLFNETWTFSDRRAGSGPLARLGRFQLVSLAAAAMQWLVFGYGCVAIFRLLEGPAALQAWQQGGFVQTWIVGPVARPPEVGLWVYVAQCLGIGVGMFWNFLANFHWTWSGREE